MWYIYLHARTCEYLFKNMFHKYLVATVAVILIYEVSSQSQLPRVIEGTPTSIDRYPIVAQLLLDSWGNQQFVQHCAGVIVTARHVISTAHCFQYNSNTGRNYALPKYWKIRVGSSYRTHGGVIHNLKNIIPHNGFDSHYYTNDIAVVIVHKPFKFNNNVRQSTIIKQYVELKPNSISTLIGWGVLERQPEPDGPLAIRPSQRESQHYKIPSMRSPFENLTTSIITGNNKNVGGSQPDQLQHTTMFTIDQNVCRSRYNSIGAMITDSMLCAGRLDLGGPDGCYGDSGGPLIYKGLVVGLVSYGYSCGHRYYPGVYTKISHYTDWILNTVYANK